MGGPEVFTGFERVLARERADEEVGGVDGVAPEGAHAVVGEGRAATLAADLPVEPRPLAERRASQARPLQPEVQSPNPMPGRRAEEGTRAPVRFPRRSSRSQYTVGDRVEAPVPAGAAPLPVVRIFNAMLRRRWREGAPGRPACRRRPRRREPRARAAAPRRSGLRLHSSSGSSGGRQHPRDADVLNEPMGLELPGGAGDEDLEDSDGRDRE
jgi:hypothetical protein